jgi:hypothetical protein
MTCEVEVVKNGICATLKGGVSPRRGLWDNDAKDGIR